MFLFFIAITIAYPTQIFTVPNDIIVEHPFYLRARIHDSQSASVLFEIARDTTDQRSCQLYKFTVRHKNRRPHSMPEQNLTYWRNSLDLQHLSAGYYTVCATVCSEQMQNESKYYEFYKNYTRTSPITTCVRFRILRLHFLILTLYILVFMFLAFSHVVYTLRKQKFNARVKLALSEVENTIQKWHTSHASSSEHVHPYAILQSLINLPASPVEHSLLMSSQINVQEQHPIFYHPETKHKCSTAPSTQE